MAELEQIKHDRSAIYGDPEENHKGIGMAWTPLLQPHVEAIARGEPLPAWVVTLLLTAVKINRMRRVMHQDNFDDAHIYLEFVNDFQKRGV